MERKKALSWTQVDPIPAGDPRLPYAMADSSRDWEDIDEFCRENWDDPVANVRRLLYTHPLKYSDVFCSNFEKS